MTPGGFRKAIDFDHAPWREHAACRSMGPHFFFPERGEETRNAKKVCAACPVSADCLELALTNNEHYGIWGGKSERARRRLRQDRAVDVLAERPTACPNGHEYTAANTIYQHAGAVRCRTCKQAEDREYQRRRKAQRNNEEAA